MHSTICCEFWTFLSFECYIYEPACICSCTQNNLKAEINLTLFTLHCLGLPSIRLIPDANINHRHVGSNCRGGEETREPPTSRLTSTIKKCNREIQWRNTIKKCKREIQSRNAIEKCNGEIQSTAMLQGRTRDKRAPH